jgi:hypothetical protein
MGSQAHLNQSCMYAVAVRDGHELLLFCRIRRTVTGDVYVLPPRPDPNWNPHVTYHASGHSQAKPDNPPYHVSHWQRPDPHFQRTRPMSIMGITAGEPRLSNVPCKVEDYVEVFEISVSDLRPEMGRTVLSVNLAEPGGQPIIAPGARTLRQATFQDSIPWIMVTLFDMHPNEP